MNLVRIAKVTGSHGLKGFLKISGNTEYPEIFEYLEFLMLAKGNEVATSLEIESISYQAKHMLIKCFGVDDRTEADKYKGMFVVVPEDVLPEADDDEVYWAHIEGAEVFDEKGQYIGTLVDYMETGSRDVFVIKDKSGKEYMVSNNEEHVLEIDAENKKITVNSEGLVSEDI